MRKRLSWFSAVAVSAILLAAPGGVRAQGAANPAGGPGSGPSAKGALAHVPGDAPVAVVVGSLQKLSNGVGRLGQRLNMGDVPGLNGDLAPVLAGLTGLKLAQIDLTGSLAVVISELPADEQGEPLVSMLIPVKDFAEFLKENEAKGDAVKTVTNAHGKVFVAKAVGGYAALARTEAHLARLLAPGKSLADVMTAEQKDLLTACDVYVHANVDKVAKVIRGIIGQRLPMLGAMETAEKKDEPSGDLWNLLVGQAESLDLGVALLEDGIELRVLGLAKDGSAMAKAFAASGGAKESLIANVPTGNYVLLAGMLTAPPPDSEFVRRLSDAAAKFQTQLAGGQPVKAAEMAAKGLQLAGLTRSTSASLVATVVEGKEALPLLVYQVREVTDPEAAMKLTREVMAEATAIPGLPNLCGGGAAAGEGEGEAAAPPTPPKKLLTLKQAAETIDGVKVDHWTLDMTALPAPAPEIVTVLFGPEAVIRMAAKDKFLVATFGGGPETMKAALAAAGAKGPPTEAGLNKSMQHAVPSRAGEIYLAVDQAVGLAAGFLANMGVQLPPFPKVDGPIGISYGFKDRAVQGRMYVPNSLIAGAVKWFTDVQSKMVEGMAGPGGPPGGPRPPPPVLPPDVDF